MNNETGNDWLDYILWVGGLIVLILVLAYFSDIVGRWLSCTLFGG